MSEQNQATAKENYISESNNKDVSLFSVVSIFSRQKKIVLGMPIFFGVAAIVLSFLITPIFTSTAVILPPQQQNSNLSNMLGQLGGLAGISGGASPLKNPNDLYMGMLKSRTISDKLISRFNLKDRYEAKTMDEARKVLERITTVVDGKTGLLSVSVEEKDAKFAAVLANAYIEELILLNKNFAITEASKRRLFFEKQLVEGKENLANAEVAMLKMQERTGVIQFESQVKGVIGTLAQLQATIASKEIELGSMREYGTDNNPDVLRLKKEIQGLTGNLNKLNKGQSGGDANLMISSGKIPGVGIEYIRSLREVKFHEAMFEALTKQYEVAKIDEAKDSSLIQLLDPAVPAELKTKPLRASLAILGVFFGIMLGILIALLRDAYQRSRATPDGDRRWRELAASLKS